MTTSLSSPADILNDSLVRIGYKLRVGALDDGSEAGGVALDIFGQTRDDLMRDGEWHFCQRQVNATLLKSAPDNYIDSPWDAATMPPMPWRFSYTYPGDCLRVRSVRPQPMFAVNMTPTTTLFADVNDPSYTPAKRVVVANVPIALLVYTGRVTDPTTFPVDFTESLCAALARRLAPRLTSLQGVAVAAQDEAVSLRGAAMEQG